MSAPSFRQFAAPVPASVCSLGRRSSGYAPHLRAATNFALVLDRRKQNCRSRYRRNSHRICNTSQNKGKPEEHQSFAFTFDQLQQNSLHTLVMFQTFIGDHFDIGRSQINYDAMAGLPRSVNPFASLNVSFSFVNWPVPNN